MSTTPITPTELCPPEKMQQLVAAMQHTEGVAQIDDMLTKYPGDARLHFLKGSILVGESKPIEGHAALSRAVELDPGFALARFQLGFFQLTSAEPDAARETWAPLIDQLPENHYLRVFAEGLDALIDDKFTETIDTLRKGQVLNNENPPLNNDMQLIIDRCQEVLKGGDGTGGAEADEKSEVETSVVSLILGQQTGKN